MAKVNKTVAAWLIVIILMIFIQIILGGIARLTNSGLSIVEWELIEGVMPPQSVEEWNVMFNKYKQIPQYEVLNPDMTLREFKFIFFWEWIHRLWGRLLGGVVLLPLIFFLVKKQLPAKFKVKLAIGFLLIAIVGMFGWIMVASGIGRDAWLWVDAYKLTMHLILAFICMAYFIWLFLDVRKGKDAFFKDGVNVRLFSWIIVIFTCLQLILGGMMSGTKAGRLYKTFPLMGQHVIPPEMSPAQINMEAFINYQNDATLATLVQFFHRGTAYILTFLIIWFFIKYRKQVLDDGLKREIRVTLLLVLLQVLMGIAALLHGHPDVPIVFGLLHQIIAVLLLASITYVHYHVINNREVTSR